MQWLNFIAFALTGMANAAWWGAFLSPNVVVAIVGVIAYFGSLLNFIASGRVNGTGGSV